MSLPGKAPRPGRSSRLPFLRGIEVSFVRPPIERIKNEKIPRSLQAPSIDARCRLDGVRLGSVFIRASLGELDRLWLDFLLFAAVIMLATLLITYWLASRVQRVISQPLDELTSTAQAVAENKDYSLRARHISDDELGTLVHAFNEMLETIENRNRDFCI